jgi:hypothetical protein
LVESVVEFCGWVPNLVENRSNREVPDDRSVTDGPGRAVPASPVVIRSPDGRGCPVAATGPLRVPLDGCRVLDPVSLRCEDSRSNSEPRDGVLLSETLGAEACGVLCAPIRLPMLLPVRPGASIRCGGAYIRPVSTGALGAIRSVARGVRSAGADLLSIRSNIDPRLGAFDTEGALTRGADGALNERLGALMAGGLLRTTGADDRLSTRGLGAGWNDRDGLGAGADGRELNDWLRLDIRLMIELPPPPRLLLMDGAAAGDRLGARALGADRDT